MTYEYGACAHTDFDEDEAEESGDQGEGQGQSVAWRRCAISLCDVTWEPICILKFLSQVGRNNNYYSRFSSREFYWNSVEIKRMFNKALIITAHTSTGGHIP